MYTFLRAVSEHDRITAFKLRYDVYCTEKKWLDHSLYPDMMEKDKEDKRSSIFLAFDKAGHAAGTVRLIINDGDSEPLPIAKHPSINGDISTRRCVEISRLSILEKDRKGNISIGLFRMLFIHVIRDFGNFEYLYFSVEKRFLDVLNRLGFEFVPIAPGAMWYGDFLIPSMQEIKTIDSGMKRNNPKFYDWIWTDSPGNVNKNESLISFIKTER